MTDLSLKVFDYQPEKDCFTVTPLYIEVSDTLELSEWNPVVWIGRLFMLDNDFGEHWLDNWYDNQELGEYRIDPMRMHKGEDGPCNSISTRKLFWRDVLSSLSLSFELLSEKAREVRQEFLDHGHTFDQDIDVLISQAKELLCEK